MSLAEARALSYEPRDDAEVFAAELIAEHGEPDSAEPVFRYLSGEFTTPAFGAEILGSPQPSRGARPRSGWA